MSRTFLAIVALFLLAGGLWIGMTRYQQRSQEDERRSVAAVAGKFYGEIELAKSTPRHSLSNRIADMQQTHQQVLALTIESECVAAAREALSSAMHSYIYEFTRFLSQDRAAGNLSYADAKFAKYQEQIVACRTTAGSN